MRRGARNRNPDYWRARAASARMVADSLAHAECKRMMLQVADDYERLANGAEEREVAVGRRSARKTGLGSTLIDKGISDATVNREYRTDGLVCTIQLPMPERRDIE
jgi:hypothetical protein